MAFLRGGLRLPEIEIPDECVGDAWLTLDSRALVPGEAEIATKVTCGKGGIDTTIPVDSVCIPKGELSNQLLQSQAEAGKQAVAAYCRTCPNNPANAGLPAAAGVENAIA